MRGVQRRNDSKGGVRTVCHTGLGPVKAFTDDVLTYAEGKDADQNGRMASEFFIVKCVKVFKDSTKISSAKELRTKVRRFVPNVDCFHKGVDGQSIALSESRFRERIKAPGSSVCDTV